MPKELKSLHHTTASIYHCNFSVFQSAPDSWAIGQLFPVMPIHRLNERPTELAILGDLTCDSDGRINKFIGKGGDEARNLLEVHNLQEGVPYVMGMFLCGAYQEVLSNLHNLYGHPHVVHVRFVKGNGTYRIENIIPGQTINDVLGRMHYNTSEMRDVLRLQSNAALSAGTIAENDHHQSLNSLKNSLSDYTYLLET